MSWMAVGGVSNLITKDEPILWTSPCSEILNGSSRVPKFSNFRMIPPFSKIASAVRFKVEMSSGYNTIILVKIVI